MRVRQALQKIISLGLPPLPQKNEPCRDQRTGVYRTVFFKKVTNTSGEEKDIAISVPKINKLVSNEFSYAQSLLLEHGICSPFIQRVQYYSSEGVNISPKARYDLVDHINANLRKLSQTDLLNLFGQLILAVDALHNPTIDHSTSTTDAISLVHRDITLGNVLVTSVKDTIHLQLADLDNILPVSKQSGNIFELAKITGTAQFASPTVNSLFNLAKSGSADEAEAKYSKLNLKEQDCYALGTCIDKLMQYCWHGQNDLLKNQVDDLINMLRNPGASIDVAKECAAFGETAEIRNKFFADLLEKYSAIMANDSTYYCRIPQVDDGFNFLPHDIQEIHAITENLLNKFQYLYESSIDEKILITLTNIKQQLDKLITNALGNQNLQKFHMVLTTLQYEISSLCPLEKDALKSSVELAVSHFLAAKRKFRIKANKVKHETEKKQASQLLKDIKTINDPGTLVTKLSHFIGSSSEKYKMRSFKGLLLHNLNATCPYLPNELEQSFRKNVLGQGLI